MRQIYLVLLVLLIGCSSETESIYESSTPIYFGVHSDVTKTNLSTTKDDVLSMGLFSLYTQNEFPAPFYEQMNNMRVYRLKNDNPFIYSPVSYWPEAGFLSFFAYSPFVTTSSGILQTQITADGYPKLTFKNPSKLEDQIDLMVSTQLNKQPPANASEAQVDLNFSHLLSAITFKARASVQGNPTVKVARVELNGLFSKGIYLFSSANTDFTDLSDITKYSLVKGVDLVDKPLNENSESIISEGRYLLVIPQSIEDERISLKVELIISDQSPINLDLDLKSLLNKLEASKKYVITFSYEKHEAATIKINYEVLPWNKCEVNLPTFN